MKVNPKTEPMTAPAMTAIFGEDAVTRGVSVTPGVESAPSTVVTAV
jgi:hypothetical protein